MNTENIQRVVLVLRVFLPQKERREERKEEKKERKKEGKKERRKYTLEW